MKTLPMSVRLNQEEAEFLNNLHIKGAATPSDKLRAIIAEARSRRERPVAFLSCFQMVQEQLGPVVEKIKQAELNSGMHSEVLGRVVEWLPDLTAYIVSAVLGDGKPLAREELQEIEKNIADRVFRIIDSFVQMAITRSCPCYSPSLIRDRIATVLELAELIRQKQQS